MLGLPTVKSGAQRELADDGEGSWDAQVKIFLDRDYRDWRNPTETQMLPPDFSYKSCNPDVGERTEKNFYDLLQEFGDIKKEHMFVVHSYNFAERISEWDHGLTNTGQEKTKKWLIGEHDFVILHRQHGLVFFQVKAATKTAHAFKSAQKQIEKDKDALRSFVQRELNGKIKKGVVDEVYSSPGFVVMPNCPRVHSVTAPTIGIFADDCKSVEAFSEWWDKNIKRDGTTSIDQEVFNHLVMRFVGLFHASPCLSKVIDNNHKGIEFKTREQLELMLRSPPQQWITGPAGSGKTWILIEKVKILVEKIVPLKSNEKVLVVCYNLPLSKMLEKTFYERLSEILEFDVRSVVEVKRFKTLLQDITGRKAETDQEEENAVAKAVERVQYGNFVRKYDHIFVDEGQDLYGEKWPELFQHLLNSPSCSTDRVEQPKHLWVMYDTNQHLHFSDERYRHHRQNIKNSFQLSKVMRNTERIFTQTRKYFTSVEATAESIEIGHKVVGMAIKWDNTLLNEKVTEDDGARLIFKHNSTLLGNNVQERDICVLVENVTIRDRLSSQLQRCCKIESQNAEELVENNDSKIVIESVRRFKGMESKVVILYNPCFYKTETWASKKVKEVLYTAVSRCFCYLIVITTKAGYEALKSDQGFQESISFTSQQTTVQSSQEKRLGTSQQTKADLNSMKRSQTKALFEEPYGKRGLDTRYDSGPLESPPKRPNADDDSASGGDGDIEIGPGAAVQISFMEEAAMNRQQERRNRALSDTPRPMEVDDCDLIEPGDGFILDTTRNGVFQLLGEPVKENLKYIPGSPGIELSGEVLQVHVRRIVANIEYEVYCRKRMERHSKNYTKELRALKQKIVECNKKQKGNDRVMNQDEKLANS